MYWTDTDAKLGSTGDFFSYHQDPLDLPNINFPLASPQGHRQQQRGGHSGHPMSARQNKKQRTRRGNVHQRERTVTTLTEDPNTPYLVPTPSEEPAGPSLSLSNGPKMQMGSSFQMGSSYQYGSYPPFNPIHPNQQQQQQQPQQQPFFGPSQQQQQQPLPQHQQQQQQPQQQPQPPPMKPTLPPGKNDLDILQNLKKIIKDGQHPFFRAVPQPAALASIYMGTIPSQSQVDERRVSATTIDDRHGRPLHGADYTPPNRAPSDSRPNPVDSGPQPDSRGIPGSSQGQSVDSRSERVGSVVGPPSRASTSDRIVPPQSQAQPPTATAADADDIQSSRSSSLRPPEVANQNLGSAPSPSDGHARRPKFYKDRGGGPPRPGDRGRSGFGTPPSNGAPMPGGGGQAPPRSFHPHSPPPDGRGAKPLSSPPGAAHRHPPRGPPLGRPMGREDRGNYRAEYDPRRPDVLDDTLVRYGDRSYRDFSPPLGEIPRGGGGVGDRGGRPAPFPPSPGRPPPGGDLSGRRGEWHYQQYPPSSGATHNWDVVEGWDRPGDRDRFERDVPPRSAGWDYRGEREFIARDGYPSAPPLDDRSYASGPPPNRDIERGRTPRPYSPPYGRVRPRSPSPMRPTGPGSLDDSRPLIKRPREDFTPVGYYPPHVPLVGNRDGPNAMRRPPGEYPPPPPRSASSGPPPSSASSWPPPSSASGPPGARGPPGDRDREYRMARDGMDFPPPSAGYDRPRSPPGPMARHYGRGGGGGPSGYGRGDPRDRGGYGRP